MSFLNLEEKIFLITGVANKKSVAAHVARSLIENGASIIFTAQNEKNLVQVSKLFPDAKAIIVDVEDKNDLDNLKEILIEENITLDGMLHSIAFANFDNPVAFHETTRENFLQATQISAFSFVELSNAIKDSLCENASMLTISISNTKATNYGYLGPVKAMLEANTNFLAKSFSQFSRVRFNAIGAGPLKTSASAGIPNYIDNYVYAENLTLRKQALKTNEVADTAVFLLSERSSGINAQTLIIDCGMSSNYFDEKSVESFSKQNL
jgi:enoyl-[acyl-carrier protein] reductase I